MDRIQNSLVIFSEFKQISWFLLPLKSLESLWFSDVRANGSQLVRLNSLDIRSKTWKRFLDCLW